METAMKVKDAMHHGAQWLEVSTPLVEIARKMREHDVGAIPIGDKDKLVGMVTDRDIAMRAVADSKDASKLTARDVMSKGIVYCRDTEEVEDAMRIMEQKKIRRLPVLNEQKRLVGMLSLGDIAHSTPRQISGQTLTAVSAHHA
jgi:CBS domain-containing protein